MGGNCTVYEEDPERGRRRGEEDGEEQASFLKSRSMGRKTNLRNGLKSVVFCLFYRYVYHKMENEEIYKANGWKWKIENKGVIDHKGTGFICGDCVNCTPVKKVTF